MMPKGKIYDDNSKPSLCAPKGHRVQATRRKNVEENNLVARDLDRLDVLCPAVLDTSWDDVEVAGSAVRGIENAH